MEYVQASDAKNAFGELMSAADRGVPTTITHYMKPRAVVVPFAWFEAARSALEVVAALERPDDAASEGVSV